MDKAEIKYIGDFVKDLEEALVEWDYDHVGLQARLQELYEIIRIKCLLKMLENLIQKLETFSFTNYLEKLYIYTFFILI